MSTFNLNNQTFSDSGSIARSVSDSFYPQNQIRLKGTSDSLTGRSRMKTLTTRSLSDALSGDVLFTSLKSTNVAMNQMMDSSLNRALVGFSESGFTTGATYSIPNPEDTNNTARLTGGMAVSRNIVDSIAGRKLMSGFVNRAARSISSDYSTYSSFPQGGTPHSNTPYPIDGANPSGGSRTILLETSFSAQEKTWYLERANVLKNTGLLASNDGSSLINGFNFDIPDDLENLTSTKTRFPNVTDSSAISQDIITAAAQKAYVCPALIELLIYLSSKIVFGGGFGLHRAANPDQMGTNTSTLGSGESISDHALGRGYDLMKVGNINQTLYDLNEGISNVDIYRSGLEVFLTAISAAPTHLIPDFIAISSFLTAEYGILEEGGFEEETAIVKTKYPNLRYVNFHADDTHRNHIHMSFSGGRSGVYTGAGGQMSAGGAGIGGSGLPTYDEVDRGAESRPSTGSDSSNYYTRLGELNTTVGAGANNGYVAPASNEPAGNAFITYIRKTLLENPFNTLLGDVGGQTGGVAFGVSALSPDLNSPKYTKNYLNSPEETMDRSEILNLLRLTIMTDELAALFTMLAAREGGNHPASVNVTQAGDNWSYGIFQVNLTMSSHAERIFDLPYPSFRSDVGWKLGLKNWQSVGLTAENATSRFDIVKYEELAKLGDTSPITLFDPDLFIPINQAYTMYPVANPEGNNFSGRKLGEVLERSYIFRPWGDYTPGGPPYGWITNTRFSSAVEIYQLTGKSEGTLRQFLLDVYEKDPAAKNAVSADYIQNWMDGYYYPGKVEGGRWLPLPIEAP